MAAKDKTVYVCEYCGQDSVRWVGKCPACGKWNTMKEMTLRAEKNTGSSAARAALKAAGATDGRERPRPLNVHEIDADAEPRMDMGDAELNRVLGGGLVPGSLVLLGGEPGIGKSTLLTQISGVLSQNKKVLYVSGEESAAQIKNRAERVNINCEGIELLCTTKLEDIEDALKINADYKLKNSKFTEKTFKKGLDIVIIQYVANVENELVFKTKEDNDKYYISNSFELFMDNILNGNVSRDVFQSVNKYFHDVITDNDNDFGEEKEELINFLMLTEEYDENQLSIDLNPDKIRQDYQEDYDRIYSDESLNRVQKSLALKELLHMSICQVVNDIDLFFTRPFDLTPEEVAEKNKQEAKALEREMQLS